MEQGPTRRRSTCEKDRARAKMEQEQSKRDCAREQRRKQNDNASEEGKTKAKRGTALCSLSETLQTTACLGSIHIDKLKITVIKCRNNNEQVSYSNRRNSVCTCQGSTPKSSLHDPANGNGLLQTEYLRRILPPSSDSIGAICTHYHRLSHEVLCENIVGMDARRLTALHHLKTLTYAMRTKKK